MMAPIGGAVSSRPFLHQPSLPGVGAGDTGGCRPRSVHRAAAGTRHWSAWFASGALSASLAVRMGGDILAIGVAAGSTEGFACGLPRQRRHKLVQRLGTNRDVVTISAMGDGMLVCGASDACRRGLGGAAMGARTRCAFVSWRGRLGLKHLGPGKRTRPNKSRSVAAAPNFAVVTGSGGAATMPARSAGINRLEAAAGAR